MIQYFFEYFGVQNVGSVGVVFELQDMEIDFFFKLK